MLRPGCHSPHYLNQYPMIMPIQPVADATRPAFSLIVPDTKTTVRITVPPTIPAKENRMAARSRMVLSFNVAAPYFRYSPFETLSGLSHPPAKIPQGFNVDGGHIQTPTFLVGMALGRGRTVLPVQHIVIM